MYLETLSRNKERVNIMSTTFNFGLRLCVFVCGVPPVAKKNHKRHMGSAKTKPGCQSPTDGGGRGGGHVYTAVYDKQPYTCVYYMRRI